MNQHPLLSTLRTYTPFPEDEAAYFLSFFTERSYKRNVVLLEEGNVANEVFFILKGALRQFFVNEEGLEKTCNFSFENEFLTDLESFSRKSRSASSIISIEPTDCLVLTCSAAVEAIRTSPATAEFFRTVVENIATETIRRTKSLLSLSPERQFEELLQNKPGLLQRVPQRYVAQYLGIAPESLSRIRKRMFTYQKS